MYDLIVKNARLYPMVDGLKPHTSDTFAVSDGVFKSFTASDDAHNIVDAKGCVVLPGFIDCHTHAVYAGNRAAEYHQRLNGKSYESIADDGGGIMSSVRAVREASMEQLVAESTPRLQALLNEGVTSVEIKSGYGLDTDNEAKMLYAIQALKQALPQNLTGTFLGLHTVPKSSSKSAYVNEVLTVMLPKFVGEGLVDALDIYVESVAFDLVDLSSLAIQAKRHKLPFRVHAEQLSASGAAEKAATLGAVSCDHLEFLDDAGAKTMADHGCMAVLLPNAFYFLAQEQKPPLNLLRKHGVSMAVASDLNPGTAPIVSLLTAMHFACRLFGMTAEEVITGVTKHAAKVIGRDGSLGILKEQAQADFCIWDIDDPSTLLYQLGGIKPTQIYIKGQPL